MNHLRFVLAALLASALVSCAKVDAPMSSAEDASMEVAEDASMEVAEEGSVVQFTADEVREYLVGRTHIWTPELGGGNGGAYYAEDGSLIAVWEGVHSTGRWVATDDGELCWRVNDWGYTPCEQFFHDGEGGVLSYYEGEWSQPAEIRDGNLIDQL